MITSLENLLTVKGLWMTHTVLTATHLCRIPILIVSAALFVGAHLIGRSTTYLMIKRGNRMRDVINFITGYHDKVEQIINVVENEEDIVTAITILSVAIDAYADRKGLKSSEVWECMDTVQKAVHAEYGDYRED